VLSPEFAKRGRYALIPDDDYPPLRQKMVLLKPAGAVAEKFYAFVQSAAARSILERHGFAVPD
jgi:molybdate transport system substrate-binding protein